MVLRDIRKSIPATKLTDPNNFPEPEYKRYPLMMLQPPEDGKKGRGLPYLDEGGRPIVVNNPDEEEAFRAEHPECPEIRDPEDQADELQRLREENARFRAAQTAPEAQPNAQAPSSATGAAGLMKQSRTEDDAPKPNPGKAPKPGSKLD